MLYNYNNYNFDIVFNSDDFIIQIEDTSDDNKLYSNIYTFEEIKIINNFFDSIDIIEKLIKYCFDKKENYVLNITNSKIIKLEFIQINELTKIELKLDIFPIRKDLSTNSEIISLKKTINNLENKINNLEKNNINNLKKINTLENITNRFNIYNNYGCVCFSKLDLYTISILYTIDRGIANDFAYIISEQDIKNPKDINEKGVININAMRSNLSAYNHMKYNVVMHNNKILNYNYNIYYDIDFELLNLSSIIFYDINIIDDEFDDNETDNSELDDNDSGDSKNNHYMFTNYKVNYMFNINQLNDKIKKIIFVNCKIYINTIKKLNERCHMYFYRCEIISIIGLYNTNITIKIIDTKTDNILDNIFLKRAIIENTFIDNSNILLV
jgi:hypothetical protein